jgi:ABC-type uncharacterized transport system permease subunit
MNTRTSLIAVGVTLALVAPAAANARAVVNQSGDMYSKYFASEHDSHAFATTNFVSENGHMVTKANKSTFAKPYVIYRTPLGPSGRSTGE